MKQIPLGASGFNYLVLIIVIASAIFGPIPVQALENGVSRTPPMGWNPWNTYALKINETSMKNAADKLVSTGLAKADYVHAKGLKLGIYTAWDSEGKEMRDAAQWAEWEVDFVKHDAWKNTGFQTTIWTKMRDAILATKRPMVYSIHFKDSGAFMGDSKVSNMWRFTNDLVPYYNRANQPGLPKWGITTVEIIERMERVAATTGPGCWADADMLMVGIGDQTMDEWKTAFAIECLLPSPLMISVDLINMDKEASPMFAIFGKNKMWAFFKYVFRDCTQSWYSFFKDNAAPLSNPSRKRTRTYRT